jgi:hypothetical protein
VPAPATATCAASSMAIAMRPAPINLFFALLTPSLPFLIVSAKSIDSRHASQDFLVYTFRRS